MHQQMFCQNYIKYQTWKIFINLAIANVVNEKLENVCVKQMSALFANPSMAIGYMKVYS